MNFRGFSSESELKEYSGLSASDGSYIIAIPPETNPQTYTVYVDKDNYSSQKAENINLSLSTPLQTINLNLKDAGSILGRITDSNNNPIENAFVEVSSDESIISRSTLTDSDGNYTVTDVDEGANYYVVADAEGYTVNYLDNITVTQGQTTNNVNLALNPAGKISGQVTDIYGNPISNTIITAYQGNNELSRRMAETDSDGNYTIEDLNAPSDYDVLAIAEGYQDGAPQTVSVNSGEITNNINFVLGIQPAYKAGEPTDPVSNGSWGGTHGWLAMQGIKILKNDGIKKKASDFLDTTNMEILPDFFGEFILRGTRAADFGYEDYEFDRYYYPVYLRGRGGVWFDYHGHHPLKHHSWQRMLFAEGATPPFDEAYAAPAGTVANYYFNKAKTYWFEKDRKSAMFYLGVALHFVQDAYVPQHARPLWVTAIPSIDIDKHTSYEDWVDKNKGEFAVSSSGIYDFKIGGLADDGRFHHNLNEAFGWVDQSAHTSIRYWEDVVLWGNYDKTAPLIKKAQQSSAGFIKFFFDSVDLPGSYSTETQTNPEEITPPPTRFTSFNRVSSSVESITPVFDDLGHRESPAIYGNIVVYQKAVGSQWDIYMKNLSTGIESAITNNVSHQWEPVIYENIVVWEDQRNIYSGSGYDIYMNDISTGVESPVTTALSAQLDQVIYGNIVVWQDLRNGNSDIYMKDISTGIESIVVSGLGDQEYPVIYGNIVAWDEWDVDSEWDIYMKDLSIGLELPVTNALGYQFAPAIYENIIVWTDSRNDIRDGGSHSDIYMKDLSTGIESAVTTNSSSQGNPAIYENIVVWQDLRNGNSDIYMKDISTGIESPVTTAQGYQSDPVIYGDIVVWRDCRNGNRNGNDDIYMKNLSTGIESAVTIAPGNQWHPAIYENIVVWTDHRNVNSNIYMAELQ